ncbi:transcriptional regulator, MarR family [Catenulispora acidiphila DSM 44928]|uniref:Transcriptional regulator, MarR family n=1 Tax=Catenulispora acidiphila (strain DSM 44928 / JCM 14897 / NBRC 102108 / NRRL B-24433 / ID139908) TaxID=479433 RepID=C7PY68_CATAD|nr:MarR family transcriptional regulator [Catenulispora acidiphila]ACU75358.1 transcriptional regulator, MarR family [Catenulispora acidiphila DSM 44928]
MALDERRTEAYFALMEAGGLLQMLMEDQLQRDGGLSYLQFFLLARLAQAPDGRMRMTDLADTVIHSRSGLTYQAAKLETAGLLRRESSPHDERSVTAAITDQGRELLNQVLPGHVAIVEQGMFEALDDQQTEALADALEAVRDRLRVLAPSSAQRRRNRS